MCFIDSYSKEDVKTVLEIDPAAKSFWQVYFTYPGVKALRMHRRAQRLLQKGFSSLAHYVAYRARRKTGIEIHPAAKLGRRVFIDHGEGVVIGETAEVGNDVVIYQGVTLGGTGKDVGKRHPTIQDRVVLSAGSKVLGPFTVGHDSKIGAGSIVLKEVPPHSTVVGVPGRIVKQYGQKVLQMDQVMIPDPILEELARLSRRVCELENHTGLKTCQYSFTEEVDMVEKLKTEADGSAKTVRE